MKHYKYIDALRGFAFLGVLTVHAGEESNLQLGAGITSAGQFGVQLFFLLSAVTLLRSINLRSQEHFPVRNFFIRRFFRIAPLFWFGIALYFLLDGSSPRHWAPHGVSAWQYLTTAFFVHGWTLTSINSVVPGGWSIAVEMTFYLCLPVLAAKITNAWLALTTACYSIVISVILSQVFMLIVKRVIPSSEQYMIQPFFFWWFPGQLPVFLMGFFVYFCLLNAKVSEFMLKPGRAWFVLAVGIYIIAALTRMNTCELFPLHICYAVAFSLVILALAARPFTFVVNNFTCGLGLLSYSCYITHFAVLKLTVYLIKDAWFAYFPGKWASVAYFATVWFTALPLTVAFSAATYFVIERTGIRLGAQLIRYLEFRMNASASF